MQITHTIKSVKKALEKGEFNAEEIFNEYHKKIEQKNKKLNTHLSIFENTEFENQKSEQVLAGIPCAVKDNILVESTVCTAGSKILENYSSAYDATVIERLKKAGVSFLGKTNMDEFAMGSSTENSAFGPTKNPHDITRVPGGSSGGSAAAVAADLCVFALGSDTGGSIRQPASFCGVVGLKPTYGRVSRHGLIAMASSLDQIGPITKNVYDAALVLNVIAGHDPMDATTVHEPVDDFTQHLGESIKGLKVGIPTEYFGGGIDKEVENIVKNTIAKLERLGANPINISLPHTDYAIATYYLVMPSEVSANLSRFDGIRYGLSRDADNLFDVYSHTRAGGFGSEVKRRIMLGAYALSAGYYDAYYLKAQKVRALIKKDFDKAFRQVDIIVGPTAPTVAFKFGEKTDDPLSMYLSDIYTVAVNLAGLPAISIPCGMIQKDSTTLPVGFHIIANNFQEARLLNVAYQLEQAIS